MERSCPACGFDPSTVRRAEVAERIAASSAGWDGVLADRAARERPDDGTWSPLEYACHVRDVHDLMRERLGLMLSYDESASGGATFANWDQDATATEERYHAQDPAVVARELAAAAAAFAGAYRAVDDGQWQRKGLRSNGSTFTVASFAAYALHDLEHHRVDVGLPARPAAETQEESHG